MMQVPFPNIYLHSCLAPLAHYLNQPDITDIYINRPGEIWIEALGKKPERHSAAPLTADLLNRLARQIAALSAQGISREHPILTASLPGGERVQIVVPPATRGEVAIAIRKHVVNDLVLEDYEAAGAFSGTDVHAAEALPDHVMPSVRQGGAQLLRQAVIDRRNIVICGGTGSGKTTFLNALMREIPADERLILIEDAPELKLVHQNAVGLIAPRSALGEARVTFDDLLIASLRLRPDRIILGELRGQEAATFLRAINTGHPGSLTTVHADSTARVVDQLALMVLQAGTRLLWDDVVRYVQRSVDIIVQIDRSNSESSIKDILIIK